MNDEEKGNGDLTYPVGLITVDEIVTAGSGKYNTINKNYYLSKDSFYWSMSPGSMNGEYTSVFPVYFEGQLYGYSTSEKGSALPVVNLKPEYVKTLIGDGSINNPYRDKNDTL